MGRTITGARWGWTRGDGRRSGRGWLLRQVGLKAGVRRRLAPYQLRHAHAVEWLHEGIPLPLIQRQTEEDEVVEKVEGGAGALIGGVEQMLGIARATQLQWIFLSGFKVSPTGLGQSPNGDVVSTKPARAFEDVWIKQGNIMRIGSVGLLWQLALDELDAKDKGALTDQSAHLNVFEVSYCRQGKECGPGYHDRPGIAPYLDFEMTVGEHDHTIMGYQQVAFPYNARAWFLTQFYSH